MMKYFITTLLAALLCCSCNEDFSADPTLMPAATRTGANTFGCLIDGWVYTGQRYDTGLKATYRPAIDEDEVAMVNINVRVGEYSVVSFTIIDPKEQHITIYSASGPTPSGQTTYTDAVFKNEFGQEETLGDGTVHITRFDPDNGIISGTFEGGRMTEGRFDLRF